MTEHSFFQSIYRNAAGDGGKVPWADLRPKSHFLEWLETNPGRGRRAIDVACGLGDHAEAAANSGWNTDAFDFSKSAIQWAKQRFPNSKVNYHHADLFKMPTSWKNQFDLVWECFTIQSFEPADHYLASQKIADLVAPGGQLLVYAITRPDGQAVNGPPYPLTIGETGVFELFGLKLKSHSIFDKRRGQRNVAHSFSVWSKPDWS